MRLRITSVVLIVGLLWTLSLASARPAAAHHSLEANFDIHKKVTVTGIVVKLEFINPHSYLTVNVKDVDGKVQRWGFELGGPAALRRAGMSRVDRGGLKPGDQVTISALGARDGSTNGFLQELTFPDGRVFKFATDANGN